MTEPGADDTSADLILFFGSVQTADFIEGIDRLPATVGLLRDAGNPVKSYIPPDVRVLGAVDFSAGADGVLEHIERLRTEWNLIAILNVDEYTVVLWAEVCRKLGLPAPSAEAAALTRSKSGMRARFAETLGLDRSARWRPVTTLVQLEEFAAEVLGPLVLKPDGLYGSYHVYPCHDADDRRLAFETMAGALPDLYRYRQIQERPAMLAEEYLHGTNHSVECLVRGGEVMTTPVVDVITGQDLGGADFYHFGRLVPTLLPASAAAKTERLAAEAVAALGLDNCAAHVEFVHGSDGPRLLEIGARVGGNRVPLLRLGYGISYMKQYLNLVSGRDVSLATQGERGAAVLTPYPSQPGTLREYRHLDALRSLPTVTSVDTWRLPGADVTGRLAGGGPPMRIELSGADGGTIRRDVAAIQDLLPEIFVVE